MLTFPVIRTRENFLSAFWQWVQLMATDDFEAAAEALHPSQYEWTGDTLRHRVTTFFGGDEPWTVVIPNERLVGVVNDAFEWQSGVPGEDVSAWFMGLIPVTTKPEDPHDDKIPLLGLASSFFVREVDGKFVLEHEIFHA